MNQTDIFFGELAQIIQSEATATLSATTTCEHVASISIQAGEVQAIRYSRQVGPEALLAFQTLEVESFSRKSTSSSLFYKPAENPVSTQAVITALSDRLILPRERPSQAAATQPQQPEADTAPTVELSYRGQSVVQPSTTTEGEAAAQTATYEIQYRGSKGNPFMRRGK